MSGYSWVYTGCQTEADLLWSVDVQELRYSFKCRVGKKGELAYFQSAIGRGYAILVSYPHPGIDLQDAQEWLCSLAETLGQAPEVYTAISKGFPLSRLRGRAAFTFQHASLSYPHEL